MPAELIPTYLMIDIGGLVILAFIVVSILLRIRAGRVDFPRPRREFFRTAGPVLLDAGTSRTLRTCRTAKWVSHLFIFWGFVFLMVATTLAYFMKPEGAVLPLTHPVKIFGNVGGLMVLAGFVPMFLVRFKESGSPWHLNRTDLFLIFLLLTAFSGFTIESSIYALGRGSVFTATVYWTHITTLTLLLATAPYTKFIHALYKPSWLLYDRMAKKPDFTLDPKSLQREGEL